MKKTDIYEVTLRILGLYLFATSVVSGISQLILSFSFFTQSEQPGVDDGLNWTIFLVIAFLDLAFLVSIASLLFFKAKFIVRKICSPSDFEEAIQLSIAPAAVYEIAIIITGLLLIVWTLPDFGIKLKSYAQVTQEGGWHTTYDTTTILTSGLKILIGLFAIVSARPLAKYFSRKGKQPDSLTREKE